MIGEVIAWAGNFQMEGFLPCDGRRVDRGAFPELFAVIGTAFGGSGNQFALPDLRGRMVMGAAGNLGAQGGAESVALSEAEIPAHRHGLQLGRGSEAGPQNNLLTDEWIGAGSGGRLANEAVNPAGQGRAHDNMPPYLALHFLIQAKPRDFDTFTLSEVRLFAGAGSPPSWLPCDGRELQIGSYQALYSLLGDHFASDRRFRLPNLQARFAMGFDEDRWLGSTGGAAQVTLEEKHLPPHTHSLRGAPSGSPGNPNGQFPAGGGTRFGKEPAGVEQEAVEAAGGGKPHQNLPPYTALNFIICIDGVYPSIS